MRGYVVSESGKVLDDRLDFQNKVDGDKVTLYDQVMDYNVKHFGLETAVITNAFLKNHEGVKTYVLKADEPFEIVIDYEIKTPMKEIYTLDGVWISGTNTQLGKKRVNGDVSKGKVIYKGKEMPLLTGKYILQVSITDIDGTPLDFYRDYCHFDVINSKRDSGLIYMANDWEII